MNRKKVALLILDGWGYGKQNKSDVIYQADTPVFDELIASQPNARLLTDGEHVGLPQGQMGNSEVGHLNIGAGRVVYQDLVKINKAIEDGSFFENNTLRKAFEYAKEHGKQVHYLGLVSDGGIHSHINHLLALCEMANKMGVKNSYVHAFTDGRDTDPKSGIHYLKKVEDSLAGSSTKIASVIGRYYAMDRDLRWERIKEAYDLLVHAKGHATNKLQQAMQASYDAGVTDEFIKPIIVQNEEGQALTTIQEGDVVICFNFRTDRCREITRALHQEDLSEHQMHPLRLHYVTMTNYDDQFKGIEIVFKKDNLSNTLGEIISKNGLGQIRIAETEKYPHVTFFFSGGREHPFEGEKRIMANSPKVATYDLQPEMSAAEVTDKIIAELKTEETEFVCLNFANPDMVGHTGVFSAIKKAVETVDSCMGEIVEVGKQHGYSFIIIADHGNADYAINEDGSPNTAHTTNPVPIILIDEDVKNIRNGKLADVAPSILHLLNISIPEEMTGEVLIN